jgi:hypothetical protein
MRAGIFGILNVLAIGAGLLWVTPASSADETLVVPLDAGVTMRVSPLRFNRWLPHAYYDQAITSLPAIHKELTVIASRRLGYVGNVAYSLIVYRLGAEPKQIVLNGAVQYNDKAWRIEVACVDGQYGDVMMQVLEAISQLAWHNR